MNEAVHAPRLMLAAPASGAGKTTLVIALLRALQEGNLRPAAFKCGPDYIDPMFHREALGVSGYNLDLFLADREIVRGLLARGSRGADVSIVEGVMGYYDGVGDTMRASAWHVATETETPAVLVVRPKGAFLSVAALVKGFLDFRANSHLAGVILNGCAAALHDKLAPVIERETGLKVFGFMPEVPEARLSSRHLGLVTPEQVKSLDDKIAALSENLRRGVDVAALLDLARTAPPLVDRLPVLAPERPVRIAVARDAAFCFYYRENLEMLEALGAETVFFSPLDNKRLPENIGALYLGGGYPEMHAGSLSENVLMRQSIAEAIAGGMPVLAECGGFLYLQDDLQDRDGNAHPMCGAVPGSGLKGERLGRFGYIELSALEEGLLGSEGTRLRGHEFHYWNSSDCGTAFRAEKASGGAGWTCCHSSPTLFAGFPHLYFWSNPDAARSFVKAAVRYRDTGRRT